MTEKPPKAVVDAVKAMFDGIAKHDDHAWRQVGRCVYCDDCHQRLYQGIIPKEHVKVKLSSAVREPDSTREMRERWQKD